jgi:glucose/arabinose dehydrogenase
MTRTRPLVLTTLAASLLWLSGCDGNAANGTATQDTAAPQAATSDTTAAPAADAIEGLPFASTAIASFNEPWAIGFLPDGSVLITEKSGVPAVANAGQGGLGDIKPHPQFAENGIVYLSYAEDGEGGRGAAVARARLDLDAGALQDVSVIWRQVPKVDGNGHYGHRIAFDGDGKLWISSGERQKFDPSQSMQSNLGKIVRLNDDGSVPDDNPFAGKGWVSRSTRRAACGTARWARPAATSSTSSSAARTTATRPSPTATTTTVVRFPTTTRVRSSRSRRSPGRR